MAIKQVFPTKLYVEPLRAGSGFLDQMMLEIEDLVNLDVAGHEWSRENYRNGFTSYASANELHRHSPTFLKLETMLDRHVAKFARALDLDLSGGKLKMSTCWANVMHANTHHGLHIHPLSVISGTFYVNMPSGSGAIKFEDPRLPFFMHAPPKKLNPKENNRSHIEVAAKAGTIVLFESWLRHEVPMHAGKEPRISVSFNYDWQ